MRAVQIGLGGWGKNHARVLSELGALSAVCDADAARAAEFGERYSVPHYASPDAMLESEEFEAAFVVTPTSTHAEIAGRLLRRKKHVFVEKPLTYGSGEGGELARLAERNRVILTCGYIERFNPAVARVREMVGSGRHGELVMLEFHRENRMPLHVKDVGVIYDTAVHDIDTANWLFGSMPQVVFARAGRIRHDHEDHASIMLGYGGGRTAIITANWITPKRQRRLGAVCTEAVITSDFITQEVTVDSGGGPEAVGGDGQEPLLLEIRSFLGAAGGGAAHPVTAREAVSVTRIAEAALLSSQNGAPMYLEL